MTNFQELLQNLQQLGLVKCAEYLPNFVSEEANKNLSLTEALLVLTNKELEYIEQEKFKQRIRNARFPKSKRMIDFDFTFQPSLNRNELLELTSLSFMEQCTNVCFLGNSGVGKTHLATSLGVAACEQGIKVKFIVFHDLVSRFTKAYHKGTLERLIKVYANYPLLIIDEIGYVPITRDQADWFYQLMSSRYERFSTVITTNMPFSMWGQVFNNDIVSAAILDRLIHHSKIYKITGNSYRMKDYQESRDQISGS